MDLLQGVQDRLEENADVENEVPSVESDAVSLEKLLKIVEKLNISVGNKEQLEELLKKKAGKGMLGGFMPDAFKNIGGVENEAETLDRPMMFLYLLVLVAVVLMVLVFFGYKLYRSHADRERKREEKRRLKQQKKKK